MASRATRIAGSSKPISPVWKGKARREVFDADDSDDDEPTFTRLLAARPRPTTRPAAALAASRSSSPPAFIPPSGPSARSARPPVSEAAGPSRPSPPPFVRSTTKPVATSGSAAKRSLPPPFVPPMRVTRRRSALTATAVDNVPVSCPPPPAPVVRAALKTFRWRNHGSSPSIVYTTCRDEVEQLVPCLQPGPLSFDMEWPVSFGRKTENKTALIQVSDGKIILLVQISAMYYKIPPSLLAVIQSPTRLLYGVNIRNDCLKLARDFPSLGRPQGFVDLSHISRELDPARWGAEGRRLISLAKLTEAHVGETLEKPKERTSDWRKPLTERQRDYAASDVQCGWAILERLRALHAGGAGAEGETWEALLDRLKGDDV